jgi:hypothetical protein
MPGGKKMTALSRSPVHEGAQPSRKGLAWHFDFLGEGFVSKIPLVRKGKIMREKKIYSLRKEVVFPE